MRFREALSSVVVIAATSIALASFGACRQHAQIQGQTLDGFGHPLADARITISGSTFETVTDSSGKYGIDFVPGEITLIASKDGYVPARISLSLAVKEAFPAEPLTLYAIPSTTGIFFFAQTFYMPLPQGRLERKNTEHAFTFTGPLLDFSFGAAGDFTVLDHSTSVRFFARLEDEVRLFRLLEGDEILHRTRHMTGDRDRGAEIIEETVIPVPGIKAAIRSSTLPPGRYAFAATALRDGVEVVDPIFPFEVR